MISQGVLSSRWFVNERNIYVATERRLLGAREVCDYLSIGRNRGLEFAKSIGAEIRIGRRCLYDKAVIDRYLDTLAGE